MTEVAVASEFKLMADFWKTPEGQASLANSTAHGLEMVRKKK